MEPTYREGDVLMVDHGRRPRIGDVVVAEFPDGTVALKRATEMRENGWWLLSDNPEEGVDSRHRGVIAPERIRAVVRLRLPRFSRR